VYIIQARLLLLLTRCIPGESGFDLVPYHFPHTSERRETPYNTGYRSVLNSHMSRRRETPYNTGYRSVLKDWYWFKKNRANLAEKIMNFFLSIGECESLFIRRSTLPIQDRVKCTRWHFKFSGNYSLQVYCNLRDYSNKRYLYLLLYIHCCSSARGIHELQFNSRCYDSFVLYAWLTSAFSSLLVFIFIYNEEKYF